MKTLADLKRELRIGRKCVLLERFGQKCEQEREVVKIQTNSWCFKTLEKPATWLDIPKASLVEFDGVNIKIYNAGHRPLTSEERAIKDGWELLRNKEAEMMDALTDGSCQFYREQAYYTKHKAMYLIGYRAERGMCFDHNSGLIRDETVKGDRTLFYKLI